MRRLTSLVLATSLLVGLLAVPATAQEEQADITSTVVGSRSFDILEALVIEAGLAGALSADDPLELGDVTVFAPTDRAFRSLVFEYLRSNGTRWWSAYKTAFRSSEKAIADTIIDVAGDNLGAVLLYHVSNELGAVPASVAVTVKDLDLATLNGATVEVDGFRNRYVRLTDEVGRRSWVVKTDIEASNGIIHAINRVILPFGL
jgi:uncharacterized surface protein with fasciclin (FAS1) repeats